MQHRPAQSSTKVKPTGSRPKNNGLFTVRVDCPPTLQSAFRDFVLVCIWPYVIITCVLKRILHNKQVIFIQILESPSPPYCYFSVRKLSGVQWSKKHEKCIFESPHNDMKDVLSIRESNFNDTNGSKFSHLITVGAEGSDTPPPFRSTQGWTTCCSLAAWLRENGERMRQWRGNGERIRKWREIHSSLHFCIFSLFPPSLSISYIKTFVAKC